MRIGHPVGLLLLLITSITPAAAAGQWVSEIPGAATFPLVQGGRAATIIHDPADHRVVSIAVQDLAADIERVTGVRPAVRSASSAEHTGPAVIVGALGRSRAIDDLVRNRALDVRDLEGAWESFVIANVPGDGAGGPPTLVIAGSDRRGTAFGAYELAQAIGVSPWLLVGGCRPGPEARAPRGRGPAAVRAAVGEIPWHLHQ
jgi:hypothetical protein